MRILRVVSVRYVWGVYRSLFVSTGQEQDSFGGGFQRDQSFSGEITQLNFWSRVLDEGTIRKVRGSFVYVYEALTLTRISTSIRINT